jgi:hypothetical protein
MMSGFGMLRTTGLRLRSSPTNRSMMASRRVLMSVESGILMIGVVRGGELHLGNHRRQGAWAASGENRWAIGAASGASEHPIFGELTDIHKAPCQRIPPGIGRAAAALVKQPRPALRRHRFRHGD